MDLHDPHGLKQKRYWRNREYILRRDPVCKACNERASEEADHIIALSLGGEDTLENMQGLCRRCHAAKSKVDKQKAYRNRVKAKIQKVGSDGFLRDGGTSIRMEKQRKIWKQKPRSRHA